MKLLFYLNCFDMFIDFEVKILCGWDLFCVLKICYFVCCEIVLGCLLI